MKKSPLIIIPAILIGLTGVYALVANLLPDTSEFPRVPTADGTIGGYIAKILGTSDIANYNGDGTVANTLTLSGLTEDKVLKSMKCTDSSSVWTGLNNGTPTCGTDDIILGYIGTGTVLSGSVTAYHASGSFSVLALGSPIREGDIIKTDIGAGITITFVDGSLLRIDGDSTVSLDIGTTYDGQSIAYAILENGGLWGRVLTETGGYYIGNDDLIAGVRGTSVEFKQTYPGDRGVTVSKNPNTGLWDIVRPESSPYGTLSIIHSRTPEDEAAATVECTSASGVTTFDLIKGQQINYNPYPGMNVCERVKEQAENRYVQEPQYFYSQNPTIAANTIADLNYMSGRLAVVGPNGLTQSQREIFMSEFNVTQPEGTEEKSAICSPPGLQTKTYWDSFVGRDQAIFPVCQDSNILAYANYNNVTNEYKNLYLSGTSIFGSGTLGEANKPNIVYTGSKIESILNGNWSMNIPFTLSAGTTQYLVNVGTGTAGNTNIRVYYDGSSKLWVFVPPSSYTGVTLPLGSYNGVLQKSGSNISFQISGLMNVSYSFGGFTLGKLYIGRYIDANPYPWSGNISSIQLK